MKRKIILTLMVITIFCGAEAFCSQQTILDKIENSVYGFTYNNESETSRLNRLEEKIYGKTNKGSNQTRIAKLKKDMSADLIGQEISPKEDTFMDDNDHIVFEKEPAEAQNMDYPVINELEQHVFKKENKGQNLKTRLSNLERKTFNKTYEHEDLSTRVDRLKAKIKPKTFLSNGMQQQENEFYNEPADKMAQNYHLNQYGSPTFDYESYNRKNNTLDSNENLYKNTKPLSLAKIEKQLYHKKYDNEPTSKRLSRIESSVFGTSFPNDNENERIQRLSSAIQAQKTSKMYDSNRFNQNMATAFQIGTLILMVLACIL